MLNDTSINLISIGNKHILRNWSVVELRYDFEGDGSYCSKKLNENEYAVFGTPFVAYNHAKNLVRKYRKKYDDAVIVIKEISI